MKAKTREFVAKDDYQIYEKDFRAKHSREDLKNVLIDIIKEDYDPIK